MREGTLYGVARSPDVCDSFVTPVLTQVVAALPYASLPSFRATCSVARDLVDSASNGWVSGACVKVVMKMVLSVCSWLGLSSLRRQHLQLGFHTAQLPIPLNIVVPAHEPLEATRCVLCAHACCKSLPAGAGTALWLQVMKVEECEALQTSRLLYRLTSLACGSGVQQRESRRKQMQGHLLRVGGACIGFARVAVATYRCSVEAGLRVPVQLRSSIQEP